MTLEWPGYIDRESGIDRLEKVNGVGYMHDVRLAAMFYIQKWRNRMLFTVSLTVE
jgi:hypothetical protein